MTATRPALPGAAECLKQIEALARALPEVTIEHSNGHAGFLAGSKRFAWFLNDHHGDGMLCLAVKLDPDTKDALIDLDPDRYLRPAYIGRFGWMSIRLDGHPIDWQEIDQRLRDSYARVAPKRLLAAMNSAPRA